MVHTMMIAVPVKRLLLLCLCGALLAACKPAAIQSFKGGEEVAPTTEDEDRLWFYSKQFDESLRKAEQVEDQLPELTAYLQEISDRLYPEFKGDMRIGVLRAPVLNAFALPNGSIYVNLGLIAAMENEAQLATVLAHEGIHFVAKHSAKQRVHTERSLNAAWLVPIAGHLVALGAISGYSVEHETEADSLGYQRLKNAGYAVSESTAAFEALQREAKARKASENYFFATHPKLQKRIDNFRSLIDSHKGYRGRERYQAVVGPVREMVVLSQLESGHFDLVITTLEREEAGQLYDSREYLLAKALLLRNQEKDDQTAEKLLLNSLESNPKDHRVHALLGMYYFKNQNRVSAKEHFERSLSINGNGEQSAHVRYYLKKINQK